MIEKVKLMEEDLFEKIVGNNKIKEYLKSTIKTKNVSHSYMFVGKSGIGKKLFAREYAKHIMCINGGQCAEFKPKEENKKCDSCVKFDAKVNPDYVEIVPDGKTLKIDQIRKMQEKIAEKPIVSSKKVYVIDDADLMSEEGQNCLLKTLEEPPEYATIILIVSNESKILATIKSRCVILKFDKLSDFEIKTIMPNLSDDFIKILEGSLANTTDADKKVMQYNELKKIINVVENGNKTQLFTDFDLLYTSKDDIITLLEYLNIIFYEKRWLDCIEIVEKTKRKIQANNNYDMCIDYLLMHIWEAVR